MDRQNSEIHSHHNTPGNQDEENTSDRQDQVHEPIDDEDLCPICYLLLFEPVTTRCGHTLCATCMSHWADISVSSQMTIMAPSSQDSIFSGEDPEARCPTCRTPTSGSLNSTLARELEGRYPKAYAQRREEESVGGEVPGATETLTLCIGNEHRLRAPAPGSQNMHEWTFFVRPSRTDIIQEVQILLHPTFRPNLIFRKEPPYSIRRLGWGYFTITAYIILKPGWSWISEDAEDVPFRPDTTNGRLPIDWTLDFDGFDGKGSMGRSRLKFRRECGREGLRGEVPTEGQQDEWQVEWVDDDQENDIEAEER